MKDFSSWNTKYQGTKGLVYNVLKDHPETRNSYERLVAKVWELSGIKVEGDLSKAPTIETINRSRRDLSNQFPLPAALKAERTKQQSFYQKRFSND